MGESSRVDLPGMRSGETDLMREAFIRSRLEQWLLNVHQDEPDTAILHELEIPRPSSRIDVVAINGRLAGYEIKSDADRLVRLDRQASSFSQIFERMSVVTTARHSDTISNHIPDWWSIIVCEADGFRLMRRGRLNKRLSFENLCHILTKKELLRVETISLNKRGIQSATKDELVRRVLKSKRHRLLSAIREVLKDRT